MVTNTNDIREEIKRRINMGNAHMSKGILGDRGDKTHKLVSSPYPFPYPMLDNEFENLLRFAQF